VTKEHEKIVIRQFLKCLSGVDQLEDFLKEIFSSLPFPTGTANIPKNISKKKDVFYKAEFFITFID
jgi:hypothetical protein